MRTPLRNLLFFGLVFFPHALYTASSPVKVRVAGEIRVQSDPQSAIAAPERCPGSSVLGPPWSDGDVLQSNVRASSALHGQRSERVGNRW